MAFDYKGFIHIHSSFSHDGTTDIKKIIKSAQKNNVDFIIMTDHFNMKTKEEGFEGYHKNLLVICGEEISPFYNHYIAIGIKENILAEADENPQNYIDTVKKQNAAGLIAHPDHTGTEKFGVRSYAWKNWNVSGFDAISIWDLMTDWQEKLTSYTKALLSFIFPAFILSGPKKETLTKWDDLNINSKEKLIAGYGEIDNHNIKKKIFGLIFRIFPFDFAFKTISTHILLEKPLSKNVGEAKLQAVEAIKSSKLYVANEKFAAAKGFSFFISDNTGQAFSGQTTALTKKSQLNVLLPKKALINIICNGKNIYSKNTKHLTIDISLKGIYRVEVYFKKCFVYKPWIFSNPIKVI